MYVIYADDGNRVREISRVLTYQEAFNTCQERNRAEDDTYVATGNHWESYGYIRAEHWADFAADMREG